MRPTVLLTAATSLFTAAVVHAEPLTTSSPDRRDHSRVTATIGLFTPTGELGIEYAQAVHPNVEIAVGAGYGLVVREGVQLSIMPRLRARKGAVTASLGAGVSGGQYNNISPFADENAPRIPTLFGNAEAGLQVGHTRGPFARVFLGVGKGLIHDTSRVPDYQRADVRMELDDMIPYGGLSVGSTL
jgi:hypothetical protein